MNLDLGVKTLPPALAQSLAGAQAALDQFCQYRAKAGELAAEEPAAAQAATAAAEALDAAEVELSLATDENFSALSRARDAAKIAAEEAAERLATIQRQRRGSAARLAEADARIAAIDAELVEAAMAFSLEVMTTYRGLFVEKVAELAELFRLGNALAGALPYPRNLSSQLLAEIRDPVPTRLEGQPLNYSGNPNLIKGSNYWGVTGERLSLTDFSRSPAVLDAVAAIQPLGEVYRAIKRHLRLDAMKRLQPPAPAPVLSFPTDDEWRENAIREHKERIDKNRLYPPFVPGSHSYSEYQLKPVQTSATGSRTDANP